MQKKVKKIIIFGDVQLVALCKCGPINGVHMYLKQLPKSEIERVDLFEYDDLEIDLFTCFKAGKLLSKQLSQNLLDFGKLSER